eukprot:638873-Rhodomonas_salina.2
MEVGGGGRAVRVAAKWRGTWWTAEHVMLAQSLGRAERGVGHACERAGVGGGRRGAGRDAILMSAGTSRTRLAGHVTAALVCMVCTRRLLVAGCGPGPRGTGTRVQRT